MAEPWLTESDDPEDANLLLAQAVIDHWDDPRVQALNGHPMSFDYVGALETLVAELLAGPKPEPTGAAWDLHVRGGMISRIAGLESQLYGLIAELDGFGGPDGLDHDRPIGTNPVERIYAAPEPVEPMPFDRAPVPAAESLFCRVGDREIHHTYKDGLRSRFHFKFDPTLLVNGDGVSDGDFDIRDLVAELSVRTDVKKWPIDNLSRVGLVLMTADELGILDQAVEITNRANEERWAADAARPPWKPGDVDDEPF